MKQVTHGEVLFFEAKELPKGSKKITVKKDYHVVGESETHGNDHRVAVKEGVELYEKDGVLYLQNSVAVEVYCPKKDRHDTVTLEPSIWEIDHSKEFDYFEKEQRNVRD